MSKYDYVLAQTIDDAVRLLNEPGIRSIPLAGGTDIFVEVRKTPLWFDRMVDISRIPEMSQIRLDGDQVSIGAAVTHTQVAESPLLRKVAPFLSDSCESVGGPAVRNRGTVGGNISNAAVCADSMPALICLEAVAHLRSAKGERQMTIDQLVTAPHETQIEKGELLTHFTFRVPSENARFHFIKLGRRKAQSISRLSIAAIGRINKDGIIDFARVCPGAAVSIPTRFKAVEDLLVGKKPTKELIDSASDLMVAEMIRITGHRWSTPYKEVALKAIAERSLSKIFLEDGSSHVN